MSCTKELEELLRARGFRMTPQRHAIMHILKASNQHLSPAQVYEEAQKTVSGITKATVYRTLEFLAEAGVLQPALNGYRHLVYEIAGHEHHHIICNSCGATFGVEHDLLQDLFEELEARSGYQMSVNHLSFFGLCPKCKSNSH
jgi:Fur family transcriptional regulator, ferric uptake regulator